MQHMAGSRVKGNRGQEREELLGDGGLAEVGLGEAPQARPPFPIGCGPDGLPPESMVVPASSTMSHETSVGYVLPPGSIKEKSMQVKPAGMQRLAVLAAPLDRVPVVL